MTGVGSTEPPSGGADFAGAGTRATYAARFARLVKIEHTVFALPFAYVGALLAVGAVPSAHDLFWITVAMVGARSLAMALNRLIDAEIDARNPRTAGRELPSGLLSRAQAWVLGAAVALWIAGFDLFYALFDAAVDREQGLHSWATRFGETGVFAGARGLHGLTVALLVVVGLGLDVGLAYWVGVAAVAALLLYEHMLVRPGDIRRLDAAFFTTNGVISVAFFVFVLLDVL